MKRLMKDLEALALVAVLGGIVTLLGYAVVCGTY